MTIGTKFAGVLGALSLALVAMGAFGIVTTRGMNSAIESAQQTALKIQSAGEINAAQSKMATALNEMINGAFAKDQGEVSEGRALFQEESSGLKKALEALRPRLLTAEAMQAGEKIDSDLAQCLAVFSEVERLLGSGDADGAVKVWSQRGAPRYRTLGQDASQLVTAGQDFLGTQTASSARDYSRTRMLLVLLGIFGIAAVVAGVVILRASGRTLERIGVELLEGSEQVASASGQVASSSQSLAQGSSEQAASLEETSSAATEITAVTRKNTENTQRASDFMANAARNVGEANQHLEDMILSMKEINGSSEKISKIIKVIDEIAFQTNILALNAAVEAARAGEAGMGFAVVADEVRTLAQRSAQAAKDTAALIEESIAKSKEGGQKLDLVAKSVQGITVHATQVKTLVDEIDAGSQEQARGIEQIGAAVVQMQQLTQRNAAGAEESAAAAEELSSQANALRAITGRLRLMVSGEEEDGGPRRPVAGGKQPARQETHQASLRALSKSLRPAAAPEWETAAARSAFPLDDSEA